MEGINRIAVIVGAAGFFVLWIYAIRDANRTTMWPGINNDHSLWEKCRTPLIPRRGVDGKWVCGPGQVWRRKIDGRWQYRQDEETFDDWGSRQI